MNHQKCDKVQEVMKVEVNLIKKHLDKHKSYNNILSDDDAIQDFVAKFAWIMREAVCAFCDNEDCKIRKTEEKSEQLDIDDLSLYTMIHKCESDEELTNIELGIIKRHISNHKWCNKIPTYSDAIADFLKKYGWVIKEIKKARSKI